MDSLFDPSSMLSLPDLALVIKLYYKNGESATRTFAEFRTEKGLKNKNGPISLSGIPSTIKKIRCVTLF